MTRSEIYLTIPRSQHKIYVQKWLTNIEKKGTILLTHGVAEHSECYSHTAETLTKSGYDIIAWDLPGHGRSYGQRGYVSAFSEFLNNLQHVLDYTVSNHKENKPLFIFGHSLGGLITFTYAMQYPNEQYQAVLLSSPAFGVKVKVPKVKDTAARLLYRFAPRITIPNEFEFSDLSRDQEITSTYSKDPLRHKKFSAPLYLGILGAMENALTRAHLVHQPIYIQAAGEDRIVEVEATKTLFEKISSKNKKLKIYHDSYHEIFNDINRQEVIDDLLAYLRQF